MHVSHLLASACHHSHPRKVLRLLKAVCYEQLDTHTVMCLAAINHIVSSVMPFIVTIDMHAAYVSASTPGADGVLLAQAVLNSHYSYQQGKISCQLRSAITCLVFKKALLINSVDMTLFSSGWWAHCATLLAWLASQTSNSLSYMNLAKSLL